MKKILVLLTGIVLVSCGVTNTTIVSSWRDPESTASKEQFKKIMVVALLKNETTRRVVEDQITSKNKLFHSSHMLFTKTNLEYTTKQKLSILDSEGYDGVITMRLVDTKKETNYVPGTNTSFYYGGIYGVMYGGYYGGWYDMYSPNYYDLGFYQESTYYIVETNVFSLKNNKLIWTGTTSSSNVIDVSQTVDNIIIEVTKEMRKDGFMAPEPKK
jgi:hypothetical protein